jgi:D-inositol-3-phosphate glycosyltransferase
MTGSVRRVAMVSMHTSPAAAPGTADAGGMNVAILGLARELGDRGVDVDLLTRAEGEPSVTRLADRVTLHELAAGPQGPPTSSARPSPGSPVGSPSATTSCTRTTG